jgi:tetratricopeptide (TPR) repeat protein
MRLIRSSAVIVLAAIALASCNRDPQVVKRGYLESGNKYFAKGRYTEARIQYQRALKTDPKFGEAHYRMALTLMQIKPPNWRNAVNALRRAVELIPENQASHWDAVVKLTEVYLSPMVKHDPQVIAEIDNYTAAILKRDPNSFDGHRLVGGRNYILAWDAFQSKRMEDGQKYLAAALEEYHKADAAKPGEIGVTIQMARGAALKGDFASAEQGYRAVIQKDKTFLDAYRELYTLLWYQKKPQDAEQLLQAGWQNNPKEYRFLVWLAEQYVAQNRRDDMQNVLQQIKSKAAEYDKARLEVGDFYLRMGDADNAIREYREGTSKDAKNKSTYQKRIVEVLMRQGKRADAAEVNAQILKDNPTDNDARGVAATLLLDKGDVAKAVMELQSVVAHAPDNPVARFNLGRALFMRGDAGQARQQFQKAIDLRPDYNVARLALAQVQVANGEFDAALRTAQDALKLDPANSNAKLIESAALMGQKKFSDSRSVLDAMLKANPSSPEVLFQSGVVNLAENKYKEAEDSFRRAYQLNPANTRGLMGIVETYMAQNKPDQAIKILEAESAKTPARPDFHLAIGNVAVRASRWDLAISEFQKVLATADKGAKLQGEMYLRIGETYRRKGDLVSAIGALQNARQTLKEDGRVLSTLALTLDGAGRWNEAKPVYEAAVKLDASNGVVLNNLAFGLAEHGGDLDQALTLAQRARQLIPTMNEVSDTLGWIYLKKNLAPQALDIFRDLVAKEPQQSTFRYHLGMALFQKGDKVKAVEELKKALTSSPSADERRKIQDLISRAG